MKRSSRLAATRAVVERLMDKAELDRAALMVAAESYAQTLAKLKRAQARVEELESEG